MMVSPGFPKAYDAQIRTMIIYKGSFDHIIDYNDNGGMMVNSVRKMEETLEGAPVNFEKYSGG